MPEVAGRVADAFESLVREHEERWLSPLAVRSYETRGRAHAEDECRLRTPFQRDRDRIVHSKAFRRLRHKTQVFIDPGGDHFRTRLTHTLETTGIARGVARALRLNEDLVEAVGLGHDVGHPPFGHAGEQALDEIQREHGGEGFRHNRHSLRGVHDLVERSAEAGDIVQSEEIGAAMLALRSFMFERVYLGPHAAAEHQRARVTVRRIFEHLVDRGDSPAQATDYLAGMTDRFALAY